MSTSISIVSFAGSRIAIECADESCAAIARFLFGSVLAHDAPPAQLTLRLARGTGPGAIDVYCSDWVVYSGVCHGTVASILLNLTIERLVEMIGGGILLHAAALSLGGKGLIIPGASGSGKTTLAAWLTGRGLDYLSDELVFVAEDSTRAEGFTRPLSIKTAAAALFSDRVDFRSNGAVLEIPPGFLVQPTLLNPTTIRSSPPAAALLFPSHLPHSAFDLRPLPKAEAGLRLMACLVNRKNLRDHGFDDVVRLARTLPAYAMTYASFEQIGDRIEALLRT
jgi:hypothetical protein